MFVMVAATLGKIGLVRKKDLPALLNQNMWVIRARDGQIDPAYLHYVFREVSKIPLAWVGGSARSFLRRDDVRNLSFALPPIGIQTKIAELLSALDDKIELNRRMNGTLEASARTLFRDWFVDFGPSRAKAEGSPVYLPSDLWCLFPDRLREDGAPIDWPRVSLTALFDVIGGGTPSTSRTDFWNGDVPWFSIVDTPAASNVFVIDTEKTITMAGVAGSSAKLIEPGTTIISARGTVGNLAMAARPMAFNQSCYALSGRSGIGAVFVYLAADNMVEMLKSRSHGSVFSTITRDTFEGITMPKPSDQLLARFESATSCLFDRIKTNVMASHALAATRDALLPKLISGEIRVADVEALAA